LNSFSHSQQKNNNNNNNTTSKIKHKGKQQQQQQQQKTTTTTTQIKDTRRKPKKSRNIFLQQQQQQKKGNSSFQRMEEEIFDLEMLEDGSSGEPIVTSEVADRQPDQATFNNSNNSNNNNNNNNNSPLRKRNSERPGVGVSVGVSVENTYQPPHISISMMENLNTPYRRYHFSPSPEHQQQQEQPKPNGEHSFLSQSLMESKREDNNRAKRVDYQRLKTKYFNSLNLVPPNNQQTSFAAQSLPLPILMDQRQHQQHASTFVAPHELFVTQSYAMWDKRRKRAHLPV